MLNNNDREFGDWDSYFQDFAWALTEEEYVEQYGEYLRGQSLIAEKIALQSMLNGVASLNNKFSEEAFACNTEFSPISEILDKASSTLDGNRAISPHVAMQKRLEKLSALIDTEGRELDAFLIRAMAKNDIDITKLDTSNITDLSYTFYKLGYFNQDISGWDTSKVTDISCLFYNCDNFNQNINNWDISNVIDMKYAFFGANLFNQPLDNWNVSNVKCMIGLFLSAKAFNQNINNWDVSNVTNMNRLFRVADNFNQPLNDWDVGRVTNFAYMLSGAKLFNQPLNNWDLRSATDLSHMFYDSKSFNQPIGVSETTIEEDSFINRITGEEVDINSYNLSDLSDKTLAKHNIILEKRSRAIYNKGWDTSNVKKMSNMFNGANSFNQDINNWNVSNILDMSGIFFKTKAFKQYLGDWNLNSNTDKPAICGVSFDVHNSMYQFTKDKLNNYFILYKNDQTDQNKYNLIKFCKNYEQYNPDQFKIYFKEIYDNNIFNFDKDNIFKNIG